MTESEQINQVLSDLNEGAFIVLTHDTPDLLSNAINKMIVYELIKEQGDTFALRQLGYEALRAGGFDLWINNIERRKNEIHQAAINTANATVDAAVSAKYSKYAAIVSIIVTIGLFVISYFRDTQNEDKINGLERKVDTLSVQLKAQSQIQKAKVNSVQTRKMK